MHWRAAKQLLFFLLTFATVSCAPSALMTLEFEFPPISLILAQGQSPREAIVDVIKKLDNCLEPRKAKWVVTPNYVNLALNVSVTIPGVEGSNRDRIIAITIDFLLDSIPTTTSTKISIIPKVTQESVLYLRDHKVRVNTPELSNEIQSLKKEVKQCLYQSSPI